MHYRMSSTLMALGALRADPSSIRSIGRIALHAEEIERRSCLLRGGGAQGCVSRQWIGAVDKGRS